MYHFLLELLLIACCLTLTETTGRFVCVRRDPEEISGLGRFSASINKSCQYVAPYDTEPHSACLLPNPRIKVTRLGVTEREKELILGLHNALRSKVAQGEETRGLGGPQPAAALMMELTWDDELAMVAQKWASQGYEPRFRSKRMPENAHDCNTCRSVPRFEYVGQNVAWASRPKQRSRRHLPSAWAHHIRRLYDEVDHFNPEYVSRFKRGSCDWPTGHYTQIVWGKSAKIGCGAAYYDCVFRSQRRKRKVAGQCLKYVCNYGPSGNFVGEPVYLTSPPGEKARKPRCVKQSSEYPGLCSSQTHAAMFFDLPVMMKSGNNRAFAAAVNQSPIS